MGHKQAFGPSVPGKPVLEFLRIWIIPEFVIRAALWRFEPHASAMTLIKEGSDYGFNQTHHTGNGRRGDGCSAALVCSAYRAMRSCHVILRKRPRSHPL